MSLHCKHTHAVRLTKCTTEQKANELGLVSQRVCGRISTRGANKEFKIFFTFFTKKVRYWHFSFSFCFMDYSFRLEFSFFHCVVYSLCQNSRAVIAATFVGHYFSTLIGWYID